MSSYHCYNVYQQDDYRFDQVDYRLGPFPDDTIGETQFFNLIERLHRLPPPDSPENDEDPLLPLRNFQLRPRPPLEMQCPRVFISHRQCDSKEALRVAWLATGEKFDYWLDILDPNLAAVPLNRNLTPYQQAILMAAIIEFALLNCTHVLAVMTGNVRGTLWMPYEYGRVKDSALTSVRAAGWFDNSWNILNTPEYFHLGQMLDSDDAVRHWLRSQFNQWKGQTGRLVKCPSKPWPLDGEPDSLDIQ
jgi:hypothetical protein